MILQCALTFWTAAFPGLARDLPEVRESATAVTQGDKPCVAHLQNERLPLTNESAELDRLEEHAHFESIQRNRISNVSFAISSAGEIIILALMVGILKGVKSDASTENNTKGFSYLIAFAGGCWCTSAIFSL